MSRLLMQSVGRSHRPHVWAVVLQANLANNLATFRLACACLNTDGWDIRRICNRGNQERGFVIATNLSVLRSGAINHRLPYAFSVLDELWTSSFTRFLRTERHLIMAGRLSICEPRHQQ